ncbi:28127_t:CDS:2, partial [Gigaspora margarita]
MVGDSEIGKTSLMRKFAEGYFDEYYNQTYGQPEFISYACYDSVAILFMFDLSQISTLYSIKKEWYKQTRSINKNAIYLLIGTKYDAFAKFPKEIQDNTTNMARDYARAMNASLIFCSAKYSINIQNIFKIILSKSFDLRCKILEIKEVGSPILEYKTAPEFMKAAVIYQNSYRKSQTLSKSKMLLKLTLKSILHRP